MRRETGVRVTVRFLGRKGDALAKIGGCRVRGGLMGCSVHGAKGWVGGSCFSRRVGRAWQAGLSSIPSVGGLW